MSGISVSQLRSFAQNADAELRLVKNRGGGPGTIEMREGSFGGRVMRNLNIAFSAEDRTVKREEYGDAKLAVLDALIENFGEEVGTKAFRSALGRTNADGNFETSHDHPITGRHIEKMLDTARREVGGYNRMASWMDDITGRSGQPGTRQVDLGEKVSRNPGTIDWNDASVELANDLDADARALFADQPLPGEPRTPGDDHKFWMVDVTLSDGRQRALGLHVSRNDPNQVDVLGAGKVAIESVGLRVRELATAMGDVKSISLHRAQDEVLRGEAPDRSGEAGERLAVDQFPDVRFTERDGGVQADLKKLLPNEVLDGVYDTYSQQFGREELSETYANAYASPRLAERAMDRGYQMTIHHPTVGRDLTLGGEIGLISTINLRTHVDIPTTSDETEAPRIANDAERKMLTRFMHDEAFQQLHSETMARLYPGIEREGEPPVNLAILARRDDNDDVVFDITFKAPLPRTDEGRALTLKMTLSVPLSELMSERPAFKLGEQVVELGPLPEPDSSDDVDSSDDGIIVENDIVEVEPRLTVDVGDRVTDMDGIVNGARAALRDDMERYANEGQKLGAGLQRRLQDADATTTIRIGDGPPMAMSGDEALPQLGVFNADGIIWRLDEEQRSGLSRFVGGEIFDGIYAGIVKSGDEAIVRDLTVSITAHDTDDSFHLTFEAPVPDGAEINDGGLPGDGRLAIQWTMIVPLRELTEREPNLLQGSPPQLFRM